MVESLGLERLPAFLLLRQDTQLVTAAQGWSPTEWQKVANEIARKEHWTTPIVAKSGDPKPDSGLARRQLTTRAAPTRARRRGRV